MGKFKNLAGQKFGRLTAVLPEMKKDRVYWVCKCDCGNSTLVSASNLTTGQVRSCGCLKREFASAVASARNKTHGMFGSRLYKIWSGMVCRCENAKHPYYNRYGGRGIHICDEWRSNNSAFFDWALNNGYRDGLAIDRIDNDGDYEPGNCRFVSARQQQLNRSSNKVVSVGGLNLPITEMCEVLNMSYPTVAGRIKRGWSVLDAITTPPKRNIIDNTLAE